MNYEQTSSELQKRIEALLPSHPEILSLDNPTDLLKIPGFECRDLQPSLFQAAFALDAVKRSAQRRSASHD